MKVGVRFRAFLKNLALTEKQRADGKNAHGGVRRCLNKHYYEYSSASSNSFLVGSWGKSTQIRPPRDIDLMFVLPDSVRETKQSAGLWALLTRNLQSEILQEVKRILEVAYPTTTMRADGQVVVVPFVDYSVELVPAFEEKALLGYATGKYLICDTNDGGKFKTVDPKAEQEHVRTSNDVTKGNTRDLIRMMKRWQDHCNVPLKSFWLELLAVEFLRTWARAGESAVYYDYMVQDFCGWLVYTKAVELLPSVTVPGTNEYLFIGTSWKSRADTAYKRAKKACAYEADDMPYNAGSEWQKIFGTDIPSG